MFRLSFVFVALIVPNVLSAPIPREELRPPVPLSGSFWEDEGEGDVTRTLYEFHTNGKMTLSYNNNTFHNCGTWKQDGTNIYWETNSKYYEFEGKLAGTKITGRSWNVKGGNWKLVVKRLNPQPTK